MKNLLSKTLLCGVLATSFLLINCQKAPSRDVKAGLPADGKPTPLALKIAECTENEISKYDGAKAAVTELETLTKKVEPSDADKQLMSTKLEELAAKIDLAKKAIAALKVGKDNADACSKAAEDKAKIPEVLKVTDFDEAYLKLKNVIKDMGGTTPIVDPVTDTLKNNDRIELSDELVSLYNDNASGCISGGEFRTAEQCGQFKADSTVCKVKGDENAVEAKAKAKVLVGEMVPNAASKRNTLQIQVNIESAEGARSTSIDCDLADGITAEKAAEAATKALGKLVTKIPAEAPAPAPEPTPTPATTPEPTPEPASSAPAPAPTADESLAARAEAALPLLGN